MATRARDLTRTTTTKAHRSTQQNKVLRHLQTRGSITPMEALGVYKISRLAARIEELRSNGYRIKSDTKYDATGTRYTSYQLH